MRSMTVMLTMVEGGPCAVGRSGDRPGDWAGRIRLAWNGSWDLLWRASEDSMRGRRAGSLKSQQEQLQGSLHP